MKIIRYLFLLFLIAARAMSCACAAPSDYIPLVLADHTVPPAGELIDRVGPAPQSVLDLFAEYDRDIIPRDRPYSPYTPTQEQMQEIERVLGLLPPAVRHAAPQRLLGVYFIENMIGSGWTEWMMGPDRQQYYVIALNAEVLELNASDWITKKEKSIFKIDDPAYDVRIDIGEDLAGFYYIFFHEIAHVFDYMNGVTPGEPGQAPARLFEEKTLQGKSLQDKFPYMCAYWKTFREPAEKVDFPGRADVVFYGLWGGPNINISDAPALYERLAHSPFVTLYASQNWMEDFAELFAAWMSTEVMGRPWSLTVTKDGAPVFAIEHPLEQGLLKQRVAAMKHALGAP